MKLAWCYVHMSDAYPADQPRETISTCPVCEAELRVTRLQCVACATAIEGRFTVGRFSRLNREQLALLESFLRARGNLRELERELGISYPTVRNRIEALLRALDLADGAEAASATTEPSPSDRAASARRRQVLERLARREISADQAAAELAGGRREEQVGD
ncbi:MAG TPA: DUF2089 domain-containing protein [Candidatus Limnocylindrales bacterium]|nr:DUF2089 domain-containing protein [Candidatus Limnocylindrales bacterium]